MAQVASSKRNGVAASTPVCSEPAMGCPPTNRAAPARRADNGAFRAADIGDNRVRPDRAQGLRQRGDNMADSGAKNDQIRPCQPFHQLCHPCVNGSQSRRLVQTLPAAANADDLPGQPPGLQGHAKRAADQSDADNGDCAELNGKVGFLCHCAYCSTRYHQCPSGKLGFLSAGTAAQGGEPLVVGNFSNITVAILAGGQSLRMGTDKARLEIGGMPLLERIAREALSAGFPALVAGRPRPDDWPLDGVAFAEDERPGQGPLGGLATALRMAQNPILAIACDLPQLTGTALRWLAQQAKAQAGEHGLAVMNQGRLEPLFSCYAPACVPLIEIAIGAGPVVSARAD